MLTKLSIFISLILRHKPEVIDIKLDEYGWAKVDELIDGINNSNKYRIDMETLEAIVESDAKQRYSFNNDKTLIRANQGHSIKVDVQLEECYPPTVLYHGTAMKYIDSILEEGLKSKSRLYVHLSKDEETAINVGTRHGKGVLLEIDTHSMVKDGYKFYLSKNEVWLTEKVPIKYIKIKIKGEDNGN